MYLLQNLLRLCNVKILKVSYSWQISLRNIWWDGLWYSMMSRNDLRDYTEIIKKCVTYNIEYFNIAFLQPIPTCSRKFLVIICSTMIYLQLAAIHLVDSHYCSDPAKFISVLLTSLSTMLQMELPHVNVLSKVDLIESYGKLGKSLF